MARRKWEKYRTKKRARRPAPLLVRPDLVPLHCTGKWVAWSADGLKLVAAGDSITEARQKAALTGTENPLIEWIPPADELRSEISESSEGGLSVPADRDIIAS